MKMNRLFAFAMSLSFAVSCANVGNISYFQDINSGSIDQVATKAAIVIRPDDKIAIMVNSKDIQLANLFNLPYTAKYLGQASDQVMSSYSQGVNGYLVDKDGCIDFPILGSLPVAGKTREEIAKYIKNELVSRNLVKDPVVTVDYMNLHVSVMGEVSHPGRFNIDKDEYTIMDALSAAGDLTIYGKRECVKVLRTVGDNKQTYEVNLCSAKDVLSSPVYYLQQNDIIYVEPNDVRARQSTVNGNNLLSTSFWMSVASLAVTVSYYFFK